MKKVDPRDQPSSYGPGFDGMEKYFPALATLAKVLLFGLRSTGAIFGLIFSGVPAYLIWKYVLPVFWDPFKSTGEKWGAFGFGVFGLCFVVAGIFVLRDSLFRQSLPSPLRIQRTPTLPERREMMKRAGVMGNRHTLGMRKVPGGGFVVSSANLYRMGAIAIGFFAVLWNGVTFAGLFDMKGFGHIFSIIQMLFMLPFLTVGIGLVYVFFKIMLSLRQPTLEFHLPKAFFTRGETFRAEIHLKDNERIAQNLRVVLRKRYLQPEDEGTGLTLDPWIVEEFILLERARGELDMSWSDAITVTLPGKSVEPGSNEEWSEWSLEAKIETGAALPLYLAAPLPYELGEE